MKRTNLMLDEHKLEQAVRVLGAKTYSEAVNRALDEAIKIHQIRGLMDLMGSGIWEGDLSQMREDQAPKKIRAKK